MNDDTRQAIFDELMVLSGGKEIEPHQFTVKEFAAAIGVSARAARRRLETLQAQGHLEREWVRGDNAQRVHAYWKV